MSNLNFVHSSQFSFTIGMILLKSDIYKKHGITKDLQKLLSTPVC